MIFNKFQCSGKGSGYIIQELVEVIRFLVASHIGFREKFYSGLQIGLVSYKKEKKCIENIENLIGNFFCLSGWKQQIGKF